MKLPPAGKRAGLTELGQPPYAALPLDTALEQLLAQLAAKGEWRRLLEVWLWLISSVLRFGLVEMFTTLYCTRSRDPEHLREKASPYVYIQYSDATGHRHCVKTSIRKTDPDKAVKIAKAKLSVELQTLNGQERTVGGGWHWIPGYLTARYRTKALTLQTYNAQWKKIAIFLLACGINQPG